MIQNNSTTTSLSGLKAFLIIVLLFLWLVVLVLFLSKTQAISTSTPALLIHTSSLLIFLLLVKAFKGNWKNDLAIRSNSASGRFLYLILAIFFGFAFFQLQQFINALFWPDLLLQDATLWQQSQIGFTLWSVFIASCVMGPLFEELLFRGLIYKQLRNKAGFLLAVLISSGLFTLLHWNIKEAVWLFSAGVLYAILRQKSGSIWPPVLAHVIQNVMTFWLYVAV